MNKKNKEKATVLAAAVMVGGILNSHNKGDNIIPDPAEARQFAITTLSKDPTLRTADQTFKAEDNLYHAELAREDNESHKQDEDYWRRFGKGAAEGGAAGAALLLGMGGVRAIRRKRREQTPQDEFLGGYKGHIR